MKLQPELDLQLALETLWRSEVKAYFSERLSDDVIKAEHAH